VSTGSQGTSSTQMTLIVNNENPVILDTGITTNISAFDTLCLGKALDSSPDQGFIGFIQDLAIWKGVALTSGNHYQMYNSGSILPATTIGINPSHYWLLNDSGNVDVQNGDPGIADQFGGVNLKIPPGDTTASKTGNAPLWSTINL